MGVAESVWSCIIYSTIYSAAPPTCRGKLRCVCLGNYFGHRIIYTYYMNPVAHTTCNTGAIPWQVCSGGGVCVQSATPTPGTLVVNATIMSTLCACDPPYQNVTALWISSLGDCHIHGQARDVLCWIALCVCAIGTIYSLLRVAAGVHRGWRGCCISCLAGGSLGFRCAARCIMRCCPTPRQSQRGQIYIPRGLSSSNTSSSSSANANAAVRVHASPSTESTISTSVVAAAATTSNMTPVKPNAPYNGGGVGKSGTMQHTLASTAYWQQTSARGFPVYVMVSLLCLTMYFIGTVFEPSIFKQVRLVLFLGARVCVVLCMII